MRYYAQYDEHDKLSAIGTGLGGIEISEFEYNNFLTEIRTKASFVNKLYNGAITIEDIPEELREEIRRRVDNLIAMRDEDISNQNVT